MKGKTLIYEDVNVGDVTIGSVGYTRIPGLDGKNPLFCSVMYWLTNTGAFSVETSGGNVFLVGTPEVVVTGLRVRLWKYKS